MLKIFVSEKKASKTAEIKQIIMQKYKFACNFVPFFLKKTEKGIYFFHVYKMLNICSNLIVKINLIAVECVRKVLFRLDKPNKILLAF
jgi:hypothetical protein